MDLDLPTRNNPNSPPLRKTAKEGPPDEEESQYIFNEICGARFQTTRADRGKVSPLSRLNKLSVLISPPNGKKPHSDKPGGLNKSMQYLVKVYL